MACRYVTYLGKQRRGSIVEFILKDRNMSNFIEPQTFSISRDELFIQMKKGLIDVDRYRISDNGEKIIPERRIDFSIQEQIYLIFKRLYKKYGNRISFTNFETYSKDLLIRRSLKAGATADIESGNNFERYSIEYEKSKVFVVSGVGKNGLSLKYTDLDAVSYAIEMDIVEKFINTETNKISPKKIGFNMGKLDNLCFDIFNSDGFRCHNSHEYYDKSDKEFNKEDLLEKITVDVSIDNLNKKIEIKAHKNGVYDVLVEDKQAKIALNDEALYVAKWLQEYKSKLLNDKSIKKN